MATDMSKKDSAALARRKVHTMKSLLESNDVIVDKEEAIQKVTLDYSGDLFECRNTVWSLALSALHRCLTEETIARC
ncbi:hypothetical protein MTR_7g017607 [Medicago truncatula]|uniref:Uncharacterized protein n=1 Tax=Medicago truncatula TaxID=3880 RepID=A0A072TW98_MEDTR|nr:hypothetical protein MTR_7g017607 [Medicago truncatula]